MNEKLLFWKRISKYASIGLFLTLILKMLFKNYYGYSGMIITNIIGGISIIFSFVSEILIYKNKRRNTK